MRPSSRKPDQPRAIQIETNVNRHAEGSCLIKCGNTHVLCTASYESRVPFWLRGGGLGWVTAEYAMLPRATNQRTQREATKGKQSGRTQEIQRLIGRSLRAAIDRSALGEKQIVIDCDVLQADGGTRCAAITGGWVALRLAINKLMANGVLKTDPIVDNIAAVSAGIFQGTCVLDLDYDEDSTASTDANFVMNGQGGIIELQGTAEGKAFEQTEFITLLELAKSGITTLIAAQNKAVA